MEQLLNFFISPAFAEAQGSTAPSAAQGGGLSLIMMFAIFFIFIYFAAWRPQAKRAKEQQALMGSLAKGDEIMTAGGFLGRITQLSDKYIRLEIANNIEVLLQKSAVVSVLPKGTIKAID